MSSYFTKETQSFQQGVKGIGQRPPLGKAKLTGGHFWQKTGYRAGQIILGKYVMRVFLNV